MERAQGPQVMIVLGRHRALAHEAWSELAVQTAIEEIVTDAIAHFHPDTFWPAHPSDDGVGDGNPSFYCGAAGVIWALDYLHRIGASHVAEDFRPVLPQLLERTICNFEGNSPADYAKHGSLLFGDMGAALLAMRLAPTSSLADLVYRRAEANIGLPIRELMWGMPGSMVTAIHMVEMTQVQYLLLRAYTRSLPSSTWEQGAWREAHMSLKSSEPCFA